MPLPVLDFHRADYGAQTLTPPCAFCTRALPGDWFEVERQRICAPCADRTRTAFPVDTRARFLRSTAMGALAAAISGLAYFFLFRATQGRWMVFAAMGLGYLVGKAMRIGSEDTGGRRYQVAAALLTYAAIAIGTSSALLDTHTLPLWVYPILLFAPIIQLFVGQFSLAALQILFALVAIRWAWNLMAGVPWKLTGPHNSAPASQRP